jgi:hypothetical protein
MHGLRRPLCFFDVGGVGVVDFISQFDRKLHERGSFSNGCCDLMVIGRGFDRHCEECFNGVVRSKDWLKTERCFGLCLSSIVSRPHTLSIH